MNNEIKKIMKEKMDYKIQKILDEPNESSTDMEELENHRNQQLEEERIALEKKKDPYYKEEEKVDLKTKQKKRSFVARVQEYYEMGAEFFTYDEKDLAR